MLSDIEIARETYLKPIHKVAMDAGMQTEDLETYGCHIAKVASTAIDDEQAAKHKLILVTAITPTKAGIGKTTVSVGLAQGLCKNGRNAIVALREPSLGPCFGMKGGAAGGGYAQVLPMDKINLHFTGDFHAITSAHNMIAALLDNYILQNRRSLPPMREVTWKRVLDVNDRSLRHIITGLGAPADGTPAQTGFDITPASEIMAILCLATSLDDLQKRIGNIILGATADGAPLRVSDLGVQGAICALLIDAINPNLVQTTENTPAIVHGGPFANIAHGCNSVLATKLAMTYADYTVTEAGFGADLGAEKFYNIKCRTAGLQPAITVLTATLQGLKLHGGVAYDALKERNEQALRTGLANLDKHLDNIQSFGQTAVVCLNRFGTDTDHELWLVRDHCEERGIGCAVNEAFAKGGEGARELAELVTRTIDEKPSGPLALTYTDTMTAAQKAEAIATKIYGADGVTFSPKARKAIERAEEMGLGQLPVCIAKTQYSLSDNPALLGVPHGFTINIRDAVVNAGSGMLVLIAGDIMRMPGLPKSPQAERITIRNGMIDGLS